MKLLSLNVGTPRSAVWNDRVITTGIFKAPVAGRRQVSSLNIEGDEQADLRVHGGVDKAIYAYDIAHYEHWKTVLARTEWSLGLFGENLTTEGLPDHEVRIGDVFRIGTVHLQAIQPRFPCYKLNLRFGLPDMIERFYAQQRHGIYFRVLQPGVLEAGDAIALIERSPHEVTVQEVAVAFTSKGEDQALLERILAIPYLPVELRDALGKFSSNP